MNDIIVSDYTMIFIRFLSLLNALTSVTFLALSFLMILPDSLYPFLLLNLSCRRSDRTDRFVLAQ